MHTDELTPRETRILELVVEAYITAAEPIGSATIKKAVMGEWSSSTIRNVMVDLEEQGFLFKPHAVAGRIPTPKAFRYYVDSILLPARLERRTLRALDAMLRPRYSYVEQIMADVSRTLADISRYPSIVVEPRINMMLFKEIEFVRLSRNTILILFVTASGIVHTRLAETVEEFDSETLNNMKRYMNERFEGMPFYTLKEAISGDIEKDRTLFAYLMKKVGDTLDAIMEAEDEREVYVEGASNMLGFPEFSDVEKLQELFQALEKKERLLRLLDRYLDEEGIHVIFGIESDMREMREMSVITSTYRISDESYGLLGVIGPIRMDYSRVIPIVQYTAKTVSDILKIM